MVDLERAIIMAEEALAEYEDNLAFAKLALSKAKADIEEAKNLLIEGTFDWGRMYGRWSDTYNSLPKKYQARFADTHFAKPKGQHHDRLVELDSAIEIFRHRAIDVGIEQKKRDDARERLKRLRDFAEGGGEISVY